jgi:hypothetical protein
LLLLTHRDNVLPSVEREEEINTATPFANQSLLVNISEPAHV